jgi:uracil-DNA glycosylase family 4
VVIRPGTGFPTDKASGTTPVAYHAADVLRLAASAPSLDHLDGRVSVCRACPRLVDWREQVALDKRAAYVADTYWGRPVTGWGSPRPRILVMGLAPAAHGGNRTGRIFTGDRSGDWLYAALHRAGLARLSTSVDAHDGQELIDTRITMPVHCAPPGNKPLPEEREACSPWLERELTWVLPTVKAVICLGSFGWQSFFTTLRSMGVPDVPVRTPRFTHGAESAFGDLTVLGCFHVSQQNTFTGKLTEPMLDDVFARARALAFD